jgi:hypothetical protein
MKSANGKIVRIIKIITLSIGILTAALIVAEWYFNYL